MVEDELELSNDTNVAGSHSGVQVGRGKGFAGGVAFERIVEIYGKADPPPSLLGEVDQLVHGHFNVAQYGTQQAGT